ncbi:MAG TPA: putative sulfate exporter family transporter [Candidatus Krumholzibacteria bacterium]|nr:putative sulfate exporter family transporter [Candidatus Krumholzibacteria bacterium]
MTRPTLLPGVLLALAVAAAARGAHALLPPTLQAGISEIVLAVGLGLLARRLIPWRPSFEPGVRFAFHTVLRAAIVILGVRFSLQEVGAIGARAVVLVVVLMTVALLVAHLAGRALGVSRRVSTLIGVGTAVCGNSAISATAPVIGARDEELSYAVAVNTLFGTIAVFVYPVLGDLLGMTSASFGTWVGTAVNDTSQVVATGFARGDAAGEVATAVKLTRNALMGFVIVVVGWLHGGAASVRSGSWSRRVRASVPGFVVGFLLLAVVNTVGWVEAAGDLVGRDLARDGGEVAKLLVLIALAGVGLGTKLRSLRAIGPRPLVLGLGTALVTSLLALGWIVTVGAVVD